jgi:hypothetical protein
MKSTLTLTSLLWLIFSSCSKETVLKNETIIGKWKLTQMYNGYVNGGDFKWKNTMPGFSKEIEFFATGEFEEQNNLGGSPLVCTGTYHLFPGSILEKNSSCQTAIETLTISEQTSTVLVINYHVIEGVFKEKYVPTN